MTHTTSLYECENYSHRATWSLRITCIYKECMYIHTYIMAIPVVDFHVWGYKIQYILPKSEVFKRIFWYILKLPTIFGPIFTKYICKLSQETEKKECELKDIVTTLKVTWSKSIFHVNRAYFIIPVVKQKTSLEFNLHPQDIFYFQAIPLTVKRC